MSSSSLGAIPLMILLTAKGVFAHDSGPQEADGSTDVSRCAANDSFNFAWPGIREQRNMYTAGKLSARKLTDNIFEPKVASREMSNGHLADVSGHHLKVAVLLWEPYTRINKKSGTVEGFCIDILVELSQQLNFSYTLKWPPDEEWGVLMDSGWTGLVGLLERKEVDMAAATLSYHVLRSKVMEYTFPFESKESKIWLLDPKVRQERWLILFDLLDLPSALLVCFAIIALAFFLTYTTYLLNHKSQRRSYFNSVLRLFGVLLGQSMYRGPVSDAGKIFLCCWWTFCISFSAMYSAILVATLSANTTVMPFTTLEGLTKQTEYKYGYVGNSVEELLFSNSDRQDMQRARRQIHEFNRSDPTILAVNRSVHLHKMITEKYAYIGAKIRIYPEGLHFVGGREVFQIQTNSFGLPLGSPYTKGISAGIVKLKEHGLIKRLRRKWWPRTPHADPNIINKASAISWQTVRGAFYSAAVGVAVCVVVFLLEIVYAYFRHPTTTHRCQCERFLHLCDCKSEQTTDVTDTTT